jgi:U4/U6 small nuclear ribonucleoprotein PRP31
MGYNLIKFEQPKFMDYDRLHELCSSIHALELKTRELFGELHGLVHGPFPELSTFPLSPLQYARVVQAVLKASKPNEDEHDADVVVMEKRTVKYGDVLPSALALAVSMAAATSSPKSSLPASDYSCVLNTSQHIMDLDVELKQLFGDVEAVTPRLVPNLSALVGPRIAALMLVASGGLREMAAVPASNVANLGAKEYICQLYANNQQHALRSTRKYSLLELTDFVRSVPADVAKSALRLLSCKVVLAVRADHSDFHSRHQVDSYDHQNSHHVDYADYVGGEGGSYGRELLRECRERLQERIDPEPARDPKPLPVPQVLPRKRRGGKRARRRKQLLQRTEVRTLQNRLPFGAEGEEEVLVLDSLQGLGMLSPAFRRRPRPQLHSSGNGEGRHGQPSSTSSHK